MKPIDDIKIEFKTGRFYAETNDKFDGTANGHGYKTKQALIKARWYFLNKQIIQANKEKANKWLKNNKEASTTFNRWLDDLGYWLDDYKEQDSGPSLKRFFEEHEEEFGNKEWFVQLKSDKELGKIIWKFVFN